MRRHLVLPTRGVLLVSTDVHGNGEDFARLEAIFQRERASADAHWVILGDVVHAPDDAARAARPHLYDFSDASFAIVERILALEEEAPGRVHFVLGNHDHGHVGGPRTGKFHEDEVAALEATLTEEQRGRMRALFERALLAVVAPCGALLCHGAPDEALRDVRDLDGIPLSIRKTTYVQRRLLATLLTSYGQPDDVCRRMLAQVSAAGGWELGVVIHGHDRDESGFFRAGDHQLCPVLFGAPRAAKRYVRLDLGARYATAADLRDGVEILRLYG